MGYQLYRGYVECGGKDGKEPVSSYKTKKDSDLDTLAQARLYAGFAGVLNSETVMLDADTAEQATLLKSILHQADIVARVMETTRGVHATLHDANHIIDHCCQGVELACGVVVDIKTGFNNHASVDVLKVRGIERTVIADAPQGTDYSILPAWCQVLRKLPKGQKESKLFGLRDGDGRDTALYGRCKDLIRLGLSTSDVKKAIAVINGCVFAEPLDTATMSKFYKSIDDGTYTAEVETEDAAKPVDLYIRDENGKAKGVNYEKAAHYLIDKMGACRMYGDIIWVASEDGIFRANEKAILLQIYKVLPNVKHADVQEILTRIELWAPAVKPADPALIAFKNGVLDMRTMKLSPINQDMHLTNLIPHEYHSDAYDDLMEKTLVKLTQGDADMRMMIKQSIGLCMYRSNSSKKAYAYVGKGDSGKSTLLTAIEKMMGEENVCCVGLDDMQAQFGLETLAGKTANIADELPESFTKSKATNLFKKLTAGGTFAVDRKYKSTLTFQPYCGCIFATNSFPLVSDSSGTAYNRFAFVEFKSHFSKSDPDFDPLIGQKLDCESVYEYLVRLGVEGLRQYLDDGYIVISKSSEQAAASYAMQCDPFLAWLDDFLMNSAAATVEDKLRELIWHKTPDEIFKIYSKDMSDAKSRFPLGKNTFSRKLQDKCGMTTRPMYSPSEQKTMRVYDFCG